MAYFLTSEDLRIEMDDRLVERTLRTIIALESNVAIVDRAQKDLLRLKTRTKSTKMYPPSTQHYRYRKRVASDDAGNDRMHKRHKF